MPRGLVAVVLFGCICGSAVAVSAADQQQTPDTAASGAPVSADRVSEGLRRPELQIPAIPLDMPTFRTEVIGKLETPLDVVRRELREEAGLPPWRGGSGHMPVGCDSCVAQVDVLPALIGLVTKFKAIRREHAEAAARQMVRQELAEFCSTHDCSQVVEEPLSEGVIVAQ